MSPRDSCEATPAPAALGTLDIEGRGRRLYWILSFHIQQAYGQPKKTSMKLKKNSTL
jgi:hypothetical protein